MRHPLLLLPLLVLMVACAQEAPSHVQDSAAENEVAHDPEPAEGATTKLAIADCAAAAKLAGNLIADMEPTPNVREEPDGKLLCAWWNTKDASGFSISVSTGESNATESPETMFQASPDYVPVPAAAFERRHGGAGWRVLKEADGARSANLLVILPDAEVHLTHLLPATSSARLLEQTQAVDMAGKLIVL